MKAAQARLSEAQLAFDTSLPIVQGLEAREAEAQKSIGFFCKKINNTQRRIAAESEMIASSRAKAEPMQETLNLLQEQYIRAQEEGQREVDEAERQAREAEEREREEDLSFAISITASGREGGNEDQSSRMQSAITAMDMDEGANHSPDTMAVEESREEDVVPPPHEHPPMEPVLEYQPEPSMEYHTEPVLEYPTDSNMEYSHVFENNVHTENEEMVVDIVQTAPPLLPLPVSWLSGGCLFLSKTEVRIRGAILAQAEQKLVLNNAGEGGPSLPAHQASPPNGNGVGDRPSQWACGWASQSLSCVAEEVWCDTGGAPETLSDHLPFNAISAMLAPPDSSRINAAAEDTTDGMMIDNSEESTSSTSDSQSKLDPNVPLCPFELNGVCGDTHCVFQHFLHRSADANSSSKTGSKESTTVKLPPLRLPGGVTPVEPVVPPRPKKVDRETSEKKVDVRGSVGDGSPREEVGKLGPMIDVDTTAASASQDSVVGAPPHSSSKSLDTSQAKSDDMFPAFMAFPDSDDECDAGEHTSSHGAAEVGVLDAIPPDKWPNAFATAAKQAARISAHHTRPLARYFDGDSNAVAVDALTSSQLDQLQIHLTNHPDDCEGWLLLALHLLPHMNAEETTTDSAVDVLQRVDGIAPRISVRSHAAKDGSGISLSAIDLRPALKVLSRALDHPPNQSSEALWLLHLRLYSLCMAESPVAVSKVSTVAEAAVHLFPTSPALWRAREREISSAQLRENGSLHVASIEVVSVTDACRRCEDRIRWLLDDNATEAADPSAVTWTLLSELLHRANILIESGDIDTAAADLAWLLGVTLSPPSAPSPSLPAELPARFSVEESRALIWHCLVHLIVFSALPRAAEVLAAAQGGKGDAVRLLSWSPADVALAARRIADRCNSATLAAVRQAFAHAFDDLCGPEPMFESGLAPESAFVGGRGDDDDDEGAIAGELILSLGMNWIALETALTPEGREGGQVACRLAASLHHQYHELPRPQLMLYMMRNYPALVGAWGGVPTLIATLDSLVASSSGALVCLLQAYLLDAGSEEHQQEALRHRVAQYWKRGVHGSVLVNGDSSHYDASEAMEQLWAALGRWAFDGDPHSSDEAGLVVILAGAAAVYKGSVESTILTAKATGGAGLFLSHALSSASFADIPPARRRALWRAALEITAEIAESDGVVSDTQAARIVMIGALREAAVDAGGGLRGNHGVLAAYVLRSIDAGDHGSSLEEVCIDTHVCGLLRRYALHRQRLHLSPVDWAVLEEVVGPSAPSTFRFAPLSQLLSLLHGLAGAELDDQSPDTIARRQRCTNITCAILRRRDSVITPAVACLAAALEGGRNQPAVAQKILENALAAYPRHGRLWTHLSFLEARWGEKSSHDSGSHSMGVRSEEGAGEHKSENGVDTKANGASAVAVASDRVTAIAASACACGVALQLRCEGGNVGAQAAASIIAAANTDGEVSLDLSEGVLSASRAVPVAILALTNIVQLNLAGNGLTSLPLGLHFLNALRGLDLSSNQLQESDLPPGLWRLPLSVLSLDYNCLASLPADAEKLAETLEELGLQGNKLTCVPPSVLTLRQLKRLRLGGNSIVTMPLELPTLLTQLEDCSLELV